MESEQWWALTPVEPGDDRPRVGEVVRDTARDRVGVVMDKGAGRLFLRPLSGGREWEAGAEQVSPLSAREELSARLAAANARSRRDRP